MKKLRTLLIAIVTTFLIVLAFESAKELVFAGSLTPWQSHWITIIATTSVSGMVALFTMNRGLALQQETLRLQVREEKMKTINQVMRLVEHHVNNLANQLQLVDVQIKSDGTLQPETVELLQRSILRTASEMQRLRAIEDPFDDKGFDITF